MKLTNTKHHKHQTHKHQTHSSTRTRFRAGEALSRLLAASAPAHAQDAKLTLAVMSKNTVKKGGVSQPIGVTSVFKPGDKAIYCLFHLNKPVAAYERTVWTAVNVETLAANTKIYDAKTASLPNFQYGKFSITNDRPWPKGSYRVAIDVNSKLMKTLAFSVK